MFSRLRLFDRRSRSVAWRVAVAITLLAQGWIVGAPLADGRGVGASAHVEAAGTNDHYSHDESTCAACAVMALHAALTSQVALPIAHEVVATTTLVPTLRYTSSELARPRSRDPPATV